MKLPPWALLLAAPAGLLMLVFVAGLVGFSLQSFWGETGFGLGQYRAFAARPDYLAALVRTIELSALTTVFSILIGFPAAYAIARARRHRNLLMILVILPWLVSVVVRTYGWIVLLGNRGTLNSFLMWSGATSSPIRLLFNDVGVVIGLVHVFCPFMIISILTVLLHVDRALEEASMSLGAGPVETFLRVLLPLTAPGIITGATIVFLLSTGAIVTPLLLGGPRSGMLGTQIYQDVFQLFNFPKAAAMALILTLVSLAVVWPLRVIERRLTRHLRGSEVAP
ncbi:ABC transporter permease [Aquabacter spiritensis]|uniref:Putative spermidine/putrescine transport system permease protein n=1 Tax=Aquabacter spiritensis TaxID=933073 RepID=A0A4R3LPX4_9HYPH|nr:ABC transporter permease [Aquabacter spiritensis]TCT02241.1 putative spermidine/putrescine transport system permease protein [Aquabacter spiritensis]